MMLDQKVPPKLESVVKPILALSPHEQFQVILILLQRLFALPTEPGTTESVADCETGKPTKRFKVRHVDLGQDVRVDRDLIYSERFL